MIYLQNKLYYVKYIYKMKRNWGLGIDDWG